VLKREAKRARKTYRVKTTEGDLGGSMEVDAEGLPFTFMGPIGF